MKTKVKNKKILANVLILIAMLVMTSIFAGNVKAAVSDNDVAKIGEQGYATLAEAVGAASNEETTITLLKDVNEDVVIPSGKNIKLDLGTYNLTDSGAHKDTIYVQKGANLTIVGNGTITNNYTGYAPLFNNGTVVMEGVTLKRDTTKFLYTNSKGEDIYNNWYVICNHGTMTINSGTVSVNGNKSSLVDNGYSNFTSTNERAGYVVGINQEKPKLTINGGTFDGGMNTIKNDDNATLTINNGTFKNNYQVAVMNWNIATINGGTFETPTGNDKTNLFVGNYGADSVDKGILVINGGTFNAEHLLEGYTGVVTPVEINGGTFNYTKSFLNEGKEYIHSSLIDVNGVNITGEITAPVSALKYAKTGAVVTITDSVNVGDKLEIADGVKVVLPNTESDKVVVENPDGSYTIEYKDADYTKVEEAIKKVESLNAGDYKDFSKVEAAVKAVVLGKNITEQETVNGYATAIEEAINGLEKKAVNNEETDNPKTSDNILMSIAIGLVGVISIAGIVIYKKQK